MTAKPCKRCRDSRIVFNDEGEIIPCRACRPAPVARAAPRKHWSSLPPHDSHVFDATGYCKGCVGHTSWALVRDPCSIRYRPPMGGLGPKPGDEDESE